MVILLMVLAGLTFAAGMFVSMFAMSEAKSLFDLDSGVQESKIRVLKQIIGLAAVFYIITFGFFIMGFITKAQGW